MAGESLPLRQPFREVARLRMTPDFIPVFSSPAPAAGREGAWVWRSVPGDNAATGLSAEEADRVSRLIQPEKRSLLAAYLQERRVLLARLLDCDFAEIAITHNAEGKPELPGFAGMELSLSDSHGWNALALCRGGPVGIDLEPACDLAWEAMLAMISEADEAAEIALAVRQSNDPASFFRCWTAKEAILKAAGTGMRGGPKRVALPTRFIRGETDCIDVHLDNTNFCLDVVAVREVIVSRAMQA